MSTDTPPSLDPCRRAQLADTAAAVAGHARALNGLTADLAGLAAVTWRGEYADALRASVRGLGDELAQTARTATGFAHALAAEVAADV